LRAHQSGLRLALDDLGQKGLTGNPEASRKNAAEERGLTIVDGLEMLIRQAIPSFEAFYGQMPPSQLDERRLLLDVLEAGG